METSICSSMGHKVDMPGTADGQKVEQSELDKGKYSSTSVLSKYVSLTVYHFFIL